MKDKKFDAVEVWKDLEDVLAPRLRLNVIDRAVYAHLLRHTRLEGKPRLQFSIPRLTAKVSVSKGPVQAAIRRLAAHGVLRLIERSYRGHLVEVRLPCEVRAARRKKGTAARTGPPTGINIEPLDFLRSPQLRCAIHAREGGRCFYCLRRVPARSRCLDHVVPRAEFGQNSYRNLVSCCPECNWQKQGSPRAGFSPRNLPRGTLVARGPQRPPACCASPGGRQAPPKSFHWGGCKSPGTPNSSSAKSAVLVNGDPSNA